LLILQIETKPFSNNLSNKNKKVDIYKMDDNAKKEDLKKEMLEVKHKNIEYKSLNSNKSDQNYTNKVNAAETIYNDEV
ncbi:12011_t:CDS:2, partial [Racocetra fulgida]